MARPLVATPVIFEKSVAIRIAELIHPTERFFDSRPQLAQRDFVIGAFDIEADQDHKERRRVDGAIVKTKGHFF